MNRITLVGNVGGDAEIRTTSTGARVASFSVATNDGYRNSAGEWVDDPTWHRVVAFSEGLVEMLERNAKKGRTVALSGRMTYRKWRKDGEKTDRTQAEIVLDRNAEIEFHSPLAGED
ncbi:single-stranded DNA-binding protein [Phenylobacterium sp.]|uniref:single-stranded DNA-binding protein n=1 Tax=Phenylobacterium sp. TaxID=1871053 RepID=UPI0025F01B8F|nr:single-stranded DNA-binding protein [Phenylobacterium sp.]